jgi:hypothetical protein
MESRQVGASRLVTYEAEESTREREKRYFLLLIMRDWRECLGRYT